MKLRLSAERFLNRSGARDHQGRSRHHGFALFSYPVAATVTTGKLWLALISRLPPPPSAFHRGWTINAKTPYFRQFRFDGPIRRDCDVAQLLLDTPMCSDRNTSAPGDRKRAAQLGDSYRPGSVGRGSSADQLPVNSLRTTTAASTHRLPPIRPRIQLESPAGHSPDALAPHAEARVALNYQYPQTPDPVFSDAAGLAESNAYPPVPDAPELPGQPLAPISRPRIRATCR